MLRKHKKKAFTLQTVTMVSRVASVAVRCINSQPAEIAVVYDSECSLFRNPTEFMLYPHYELIAVDKNAMIFLEGKNLRSKMMYKRFSLRYPCWECQNKKCLITMAFLAWREYLKKKGVIFCHGIQSLLLQSPRTQEIFISIEFDENDYPVNGSVVADNGYIDGNPNEWLPIVKESGIVIAAIGEKTSNWLKERINNPLKVLYDKNLKYPCKECKKTTCSLVKSYYGWKRQAIQTSYIKHEVLI